MNSVSLKTEQRKNHCYPIPSLFSTPNNSKGEVGLELETIGNNLPVEFNKTRLWSIHNDDSIKFRPGEMAKEYVLAQPVGRPKVAQAIDELHEEFKVCSATVAEGRISNSVHVHINAQTLTMKQVYTWLALYFIYEEMLVRWAGTERVGNLFCLRAKDAEGLIRMLATCAKEDSFRAFGQDTYRYAACNVMALTKYGSMEFRALRGTADKTTIMTWVETLLAIKDKSLEYADPVSVLADFSQRSPIGMTVHVMPPVMRNFILMQPDFQDSLYDGARLVQDFAFMTQWSTWVVPKDDPQLKPKAKAKMFSDEVTSLSSLQNFIQTAGVGGGGGPWNSPAPADPHQQMIAQLGHGPHPNLRNSWRLHRTNAGVYHEPQGFESTEIWFIEPTQYRLLINAGYRIKIRRDVDGHRRLAIVRISSGGGTSLIRWIRDNDMMPSGTYNTYFSNPQPTPTPNPFDEVDD